MSRPTVPKLWEQVKITYESELTNKDYEIRQEKLEKYQKRPHIRKIRIANF